MFDIDTSYFRIILLAISALILFLFGIDNLSTEFQVLASDKFRRIVSKLSRNRIIGTVVGAITTAIIQSSTAVSTIAVILVNTGVISFRNSLGIILGANIGTTITAQLVLINSSSLAALFIIFGSILKFAGKNFRIVSKAIFYIGFVLFALNILSSVLKPLGVDPDIVNMFAQLSNPIFACLVSAIFTSLIQSSSISSGIIVLLAMGNLVPIEVAIPMIFGANLGSSTTAFFVSSKMGLYAKRTGFAHFLVNLLGVIVFMLLLDPFINLVSLFSNSVATQTALAHFLFNVISSIVFLVILTPFEKLIRVIIKGDEEEIVFKTKYINGGNDDPKKHIRNIKKELVYSIENTIRIFQGSLGMYYDSSKQSIMQIQKYEALNDYLDEEITHAIVGLSKKRLSKTDARESVLLVRVSNYIEQLGDLGQDLSYVFTKMHDYGAKDRDVCIDQLAIVNSRLVNLMRNLTPVIMKPNSRNIDNLNRLEIELNSKIGEQFDIHVKKLQEDDSYTGNVFIDAISLMELATAKVREISSLVKNM